MFRGTSGCGDDCAGGVVAVVGLWGEEWVEVFSVVTKRKWEVLIETVVIEVTVINK